MCKNIILSFVVILTISTLQSVAAQNNTNSPYTRFGYGDISDNTSGEQRAMGGTAIGARSPNRINTVNPASYSVSDTLTFMFDFGASALFSTFSDMPSRRVTTFNGNLEYLSLQFRLAKGLGLSAGLLPYSFAGYSYYSSDSRMLPTHDSDPDTVSFTQLFSGSGGINQLFLGLSYDLFNHVSLGVNGYYMFGSYDNSRSLTFTSSDYSSTTETSTIEVNSLRFRVGAQVYNTFAGKHDITLGFIYEPKMALNATASRTVAGTVETVTEDISNGFELPQMFGGGLYYVYDHRFSLAIDYSIHQWSDALYYGATQSLVNSSKLSVGFEYQPDYKGRKFGDRIMYRLGANVSNPYYEVNGVQPGKSFGITCGIGFPLPSSSRTMINMAFEYGKVGSYSTLKEDYYKLTFSFSLAETWFFKRQL